MEIAALAPWFGSKRTMADSIVRLLGPHRAYWEPFCGSLSVLLAKPRSTHETVNDLHGDLINLARILADEDMAVRLYGLLSRTLMHEEQFAACADRLAERPAPGPAERPDVMRAYDWFVVAWQGRSGFEGTVRERPAFAVRWTSSGGHGGRRFRSAVESIPAWHERLSGVAILRRDGFDVLAGIEDRAGAVLYCDPPYLRKSARYLHDFADADHDRLATALRSFRRTRVVVSYYDHPRLSDLYPGWTKVVCTRHKNLANPAGPGAERSVAEEVLLVNGPAEAGVVTTEELSFAN